MSFFFYELLYVIAVTGCAYALLSPVRGAWSLVLQTAFAIMIVAFKKGGSTLRLILAAITAGVILLFAFLLRHEEISVRLLEHRNYLWLIPLGVGGFIAGELMAQVRGVRITAALCLALSMALMPALNSAADKLYVTSVLSTVLITVTDEIQVGWKKSGYTDTRKHLVFVAPFLIGVMIMVYISPASDEPYDWAFVKKIYRFAYERVQEMSVRFTLGQGGDGAEAQIGFSTRSSLPGFIEGQNREIMRITGIPAGVDHIKLTGKTYSDFDGKSWSDGDPDLNPGALMDTLALAASVDDSLRDRDDLIRKARIGIRYRNINTGYVFAPLKPIAVTGNKAAGKLVLSGGDMKWPDRKSFNDEYEVAYYRMNLNNEVFEAFLDSCGTPDKEAYERALRSGNTGEMMTQMLSRDELSYEAYLEYMDNVYEVYGQAPAVSPKVSELMSGVWGETENKREKLKALEEYLRGFEYSESPGSLPFNVDDEAGFLDFFLLGSQKGYCSHFATAFVLLARAEGFPARYVQGYVAYPRGRNEVIVYSDMAHAWPEIYYEGAGWIPYEPTPIQEVSSYWMTSEQMKEPADEYEQPYALGERSEDMWDADEEEPVFDEEENISIPWYAIAVPVMVTMILTVILLILGRMIRVFRFSGLSAEKKFIMICKSNLRILDRLGQAMGETETLSEYRSRLDLTVGASDFISYLEMYLYGGATDIDMAYESSVRSHLILMDMLKQTHRIRYLVTRLMELP